MAHELQTGEQCPLCHRARHMHKRKILYGVEVCKKCHYKFINRRQGAYLVDLFLWWGVKLTIVIALGAYIFTSGPFYHNQSQQMAAILPLIATICYYVLFPLMFIMKDGFKGYSPGKRLFGVRVLDRKTREPIGFISSLKRNLILVVPLADFVIGFFLLGKGSRVGDRWADSRVVWKKYEHHPVFGGGLVCEWCEYDLRGNVSGSCPECGADVSPANRVLLAEHQTTFTLQ